MLASSVSSQLQAAGLPVEGISLGRIDDKSTWRIDWAEVPTAPQRARAQAIIDAFDPQSGPAQLGEMNVLLTLLAAKGVITNAEAATVAPMRNA